MTELRGIRHSGAGPAPQSRQAGLTLFGLVVSILLVSIISSYSFNRFQDYPGAAERANFLAVTSQIRAGVTLQMIEALTSGRRDALAQMEGRNPMELMQEVPRNYVGAFSAVDESTMPRRVWYFDRQAGELVYLANDSSNLYALRNGERVPTDWVRFKVTPVYGDGGWLGNTGSGEPSGLRLQAVTPYTWDSVNLQLPSAVSEAEPETELRLEPET